MYKPVPNQIEMSNISTPQNNYFSTIGQYQKVVPYIHKSSKNNKQKTKDQTTQQHKINEPVENRECTDIVWLVLFILCFLAFFAFLGFGIYYGKPREILGFYDPSQQLCSNSTQKPYAYIFNNTTAYCVKNCPNKLQSLNTTPATFAPYSSTIVAKSFCAPTQQTQIVQITPFYAYQTILDLKYSFYLIMASLGASIILALFLVISLKCCTKITVIICCIVTLLSILAIGIYAYLYTIGKTYFFIPFILSSVSVQALRISAYILWGMAGLFAIFLLLAYKKIKISLSTIETTTQFVAQTCSVFFVTPIIALLWLGILVSLLIAFLYLYSTGSLQFNNGYLLASIIKTDSRVDLISTIFFYIMIGLGVWNLLFVTGLNSFIVSSSASIWYFSNSSVGIKPHRPLATSIWRAFRYHIGSIAFASLVLGLCYPLRILGSLFSKSYSESQNCFMNCCYKIEDCCAFCFSCALRFMTKGCYTQIALKGTNYCTSSLQAFNLTVQSPIRVAINYGITHVLMLICKLALSGIVATGVFYATYSFKQFSMVSTPMVPTLLSIIITFGASSIILSVYGISSNSIVQCFIIDELSCKSKGQKAQYCPAPLREIIDDHTYAE